MEEIQSICTYIESFEQFITKKSAIYEDNAIVYLLLNGNKVYVNTCKPLSISKHKKTFNVNKVEIKVKEIETCNLVCFDCLLLNGEFYYFVSLPQGFVMKLINTIRKAGKKEIERITLYFTVTQTQYNVFSGEKKNLHIKSDYTMYAEVLKPKMKKIGVLLKSRSYQILDFINRYKILNSLFPKT
jgi:ABC-type uncharacterized transport system permease subunit